MMTVANTEKTVEELALEAEALQKADVEAMSAFTEGFSGAPVEPEKPKEPTAEELKAQEDAKADADRLAAEEAKKAAEPKIATITEPQFLDLVKKANSIDEIRQLAEKVRDGVNGRVGSLEQTIKKLQEATPVGQAITVTPEDFAEINKDLPDHAKMLADGLTRVLGKFKGTAQPTVSETPEEFEARVNRVSDQRIEAREKARLEADQKEAREALALVHPDWEAVVGTKDSGSEWRQWLRTKPATYERKMLNTNDADTLAESLTTFKALQDEKKKPKPAAPNARAERLREAVPIRGGASAPNTKREPTPEEAFAEGFAS
jgi:hypothetical protein